MSRVAIIGCGATGTRVARQLQRSAGVPELVVVDHDTATADSVARSLGDRVTAARPTDDLIGCDVVVLAVAAGDHLPLAEQHLARGRTCISVSDSFDEIDALLGLDRHALDNNATMVVGAGMMPGLTNVLAAHGARWFERVDEIHVSKFGTGGPACARQHHRALKGFGLDWRNGDWVRRAGGSGRELDWFPAPVQAADCYRARLGDPLLLHRVHPDAQRITARMAATRRDRLTMHLPMLRRPHPEGLLGAVRVELRGLRDGEQTEVVFGCAERPAVAAGAVAAATVSHLLVHPAAPGARGLAEVVDPIPFLHALRTRGLRSEIFVGADRTY